MPPVATGTDLLALTAELVDVASESFAEAELCAWFASELGDLPWLRVERVGDNLVARTELHRPHRLILGGHLDTVPANGNGRARLDGDRLWGLGAADMKGGLAVMLDLARHVAEPAVDLSFVLYAREEVALVHNGLRELLAEAPELLVGDAALLGEPTGGVVEAGCQGTLRALVHLVGERAHTARPWMGRNAIHRLGPVLDRLAAYEAREPVIDGCRYREAFQAVFVEGGVAGNVVPDSVTLTVNHRFAPDRDVDQAEAALGELLAGLLAPEDTIEVVDRAPAAAPGLDHPLMRALVARQGLEVRAKLGWTDVAFFAERGVPAANLGPGDATVAHTAQEYLDRAPLEAVHASLHELVSCGPLAD